MKFKLNLGSINQVSTSFINGKKEETIVPVIQNISVEYELSAEEMITQVKNIRETLSIIKEGYTFIKEEASNENSAKFLEKLVSLFTKGYSIEEQKKMFKEKLEKSMSEKGFVPREEPNSCIEKKMKRTPLEEETTEKETNPFTDIFHKIVNK